MGKYKTYEKYKPSGVEWLGEIPKHWDVTRLKFIAAINPEVLAESTDPDYEIQYVDIGNVSNQGEIEFQSLLFANAPSRARRRVIAGDVIISTVRTYLHGKPKPDQAQVEAELNIFDPKMLQHWSANDSKSRKHFPQVIREVKAFFTVSSSSIPHPAIELLDEALIRHDMRNDFYHDHKRSGYTINDDKCLNALCGLFDLMEYLFPGVKDPLTPKNHIPSFTEKVKGNNTVRCQIGVIRLKKAALGGQTELSEPYKVALEQIKKEYLEEDPRSSEQRLVHTVSFNFFNALQKEFVYRINKLRDRINEIDNMKRPNRSHQAERHNKESLLQILQGQLDQINALLDTP